MTTLLETFNFVVDDYQNQEFKLTMENKLSIINQIKDPAIVVNNKNLQIFIVTNIRQIIFIIINTVDGNKTTTIIKYNFDQENLFFNLDTDDNEFNIITERIIKKFNEFNYNFIKPIFRNIHETISLENVIKINVARRKNLNSVIICEKNKMYKILLLSKQIEEYNFNQENNDFLNILEKGIQTK